MPALVSSRARVAAITLIVALAVVAVAIAVFAPDATPTISHLANHSTSGGG